MWTYEQLKAKLQSGELKSQCLAGHDFDRLVRFLTDEDLAVTGYTIKEGVVREHKPWTREEILKQLKKDVEFGMSKARNERGLSAGAMHTTVEMWLKILEEPMSVGYEPYGMPLFEAVTARFFEQESHAGMSSSG